MLIPCIEERAEPARTVCCTIRDSSATPEPSIAHGFKYLSRLQKACPPLFNRLLRQFTSSGWLATARRARPADHLICCQHRCPDVCSCCSSSTPSLTEAPSEGHRAMAEGCASQQLFDSSFEGDGSAIMTFEWFVQRECQNGTAFTVRFDRDFARMAGIDFCCA